MVYISDSVGEQHEFRFHHSVAETNLLFDHFDGARLAETRQQLHELVLDILDEIQTSLSVLSHQENSQGSMWLVDAAIQHLYQDIRVLVELDHQPLLFSHLLESLLVHCVLIVEK